MSDIGGEGGRGPDLAFQFQRLWHSYHMQQEEVTHLTSESMAAVGCN